MTKWQFLRSLLNHSVMMSALGWFKVLEQTWVQYVSANVLLRCSAATVHAWRRGDYYPRPTCEASVFPELVKVLIISSDGSYWTGCFSSLVSLLTSHGEVCFPPDLIFLSSCVFATGQTENNDSSFRLKKKNSADCIFNIWPTGSWDTVRCYKLLLTLVLKCFTWKSACRSGLTLLHTSSVLKPQDLVRPDAT